MKTLLTLLLLAASAFGQTATISDTIRTPFGGTFSGTVTVSLNSPALAQPLYSGSVTLSGWTQAVTVTAGVFTLTLYTNDLITPGGTSYTATYAPTSGSGWKETWIVPTGATTIREIRSTTVPSPSVRFTPSQITQAGATLGQGLKWDGSKWAPADVVANPMTTNGDLITRLGGVPVRVGIGSTNQVLSVSGGMPVWASGITGNASTATALAANGTNCSAGSYPLGVDASGNAESCTAAVTASTGLSDWSALVRNNQANTYTAGSKQTFASNATTAGAAFGGGITADPSSVSAGDFWYRTDLGTFGFRNALAVDALVAGGRALNTPGSVPFVTAAGVLGQDAGFSYNPVSNAFTASGFFFDGGATFGASDPVLANSSVSSLSTNFAFTQNALGQSVFNGSLIDFRIANVQRARFAATTGNLLLGTTTDDGTSKVQIAGDLKLLPNSATNAGIKVVNSSTGPTEIQFVNSTWGANNFAVGQDTTGAYLYTNGAQPLRFFIAQQETARFTAARNLLFGLTTETNYKLDVGASGSSGTARIYDQTPTTGSTSLVVRAGAGQGSNNLQTWQSSAGATLAFITDGGRASFSGSVSIGSSALDTGLLNAGTGLKLGSGSLVGWNNAASVSTSNPDLSLSRASANTLQVGDGGANALGTINAASASFSRATGTATVTTASGSADANNTVQGNGAYINLYSTLAGPYAGTQLNKSTNVNLWFTGLQGTDNYTWFTGSAYTSLASLSPGGTFTLYNTTPTTGFTSFVVRAGAGQGGNNLTTWQNSGGTEVARVNAGGGFAAQEFFNLTNTFYQNGVNVDVGSGGIYRFASIASQGGTKDLSLSRASANTLQVGDGSANSNGTILARIHTWANGTEGTCDTTLRGQVVMVQGGAGVADTFRVCRKDAANAYAWTALY